MTLYVGDTVQIVAVAYDPLRKAYISDATVHVDVFALGKDPANKPADRVNPQGPDVVLTWSSAVEIVISGTKYTGAYVGQVDTASGFVSGRHIYRVRATGTVNPNSEYAAFVLK